MSEVVFKKQRFLQHFLYMKEYCRETIESLGSYQIINQFSTVMKIQNKILNFFYSIILFSIVEKENIMKRLEKIHYEKGSTNPLSVSTLKEAFDPGYNYYINAIGNT